MTEHTPLADAILATLADSSRGLSDREICRRVGGSLAEVAAALRELYITNRIRKIGGRWATVNDFHDHPRSPQPPTSKLTPEGLQVIRNLCEFYADVVQEIDSNKLSMETNDERLQSIVRVPIDWFQLSRGSVTVPRKGISAFDISGADGRYTFCGPFHLTRRRERGVERLIWLPVFLVHVKVRRLAQHFEFLLDGDVQLNMEWIDEHFSGEGEQQRDDLMIRLGLLHESQERELIPVSLRNLEDVWNALHDHVEELDWVEYRSLRVPDASQGVKTRREPGLYGSVALIREELSPFNKGLIQDLREIAKAPDEDLANSALTCLLEPMESSMSTGAGSAQALAEASTLNPSQSEAVGQALGASLTVIQGPPGTGKSTVVRSALLSIGANGQSAIFGSMNHRAVEAVVVPMNQEMHRGRLVADLRESDQASRWSSQLQSNLSSARNESGLDLDGIRKTLEKSERDITDILVETRESLADGDRLVTLQERLCAFMKAHSEWEAGLRTIQFPMPLEAVLTLWSDGEARPGMLTRLLKAVRRQRLIHGARKLWPSHPRPDRHLMPTLLEWKIVQMERDAIESRLRGRRSLEAQAEELVDRVEAKADFIERIKPDLPAIWADRVRPDGAALATIRLESGGGSEAARRRREEVERKHLTRLLPGLPLWTVTSLSVPRAVPRVAGAFDLGIIDEAGQCHPASAIPFLFRSRRAMFVGDPQQLRPVASIAAHKEELLRRKHGLDGTEFSRYGFRGRSAYDLAEDALIAHGGRVRLLKEHYRCHPAIAEFFNRHFYNGELQVRTTGRDEQSGAAGISWTQVPGGSVTHGTSRWHQPQVQSIVNELVGLAERNFQGTVGVVTPFSAHAKRIRDAVHARLPARTLERWDFISDTADGFQGGERDLILFGLVGGGEGRYATPPFYLRERNRFNVAISRARVHLHVFGDQSWASQCGIPVLSSLVEAARPRPIREQDSVRTDLIGPVWEPRLADALRAEGIEFRQQYPACGYYLDFAFFLSDGSRLDVEVDGETYHRDRDGNLRAEDVRRDLVLHAQGWKVKRFWVYELRENWNSCLLQIKQLLTLR